MHNKRKKLFLIGWGHLRPEMVDVAVGLQEHHDILYWVRMNRVFSMDQTKFPRTIFHEYGDALDGIGAPEVDITMFYPPSKEMILSLSSCEAEVLTMLEKWHETWSVNQKKDFYYNLLAYWHGVLLTYKPDVIVFSEIPHEVYSFVIYEIAKLLGIQTVMFENILAYDRLMYFSDYRMGNDILAHQAAQGFPISCNPAEMSPSVRDYYYEQTGQKNAAPQYIGGFKYEHTGWRKIIRHSRAIWPFVKDGSIFERGTRYFFKLFKLNVKKEYAQYETVADLEKKYVYFALHYQPERTTSPQGDVYVDQLLAIRTVAAALPPGWVLYVKEHPTQWLPHGKNFTPYRYEGFYKSIAELKQTKLIPVHTNTFDLTNKAQAVVTITGIPGFEAVLRGIPALIFGYPYYMHCPGVFRVSGVVECRDVFNNIVEGYRVNKQSVINYFGALDKVSVAGFFDHYGANIATFSAEENTKNVLNFLLGILAKKH